MRVNSKVFIVTHRVCALCTMPALSLYFLPLSSSYSPPGLVHVKYVPPQDFYLHCYLPWIALHLFISAWFVPSIFIQVSSNDFQWKVSELVLLLHPLFFLCFSFFLSFFLIRLFSSMVSPFPHWGNIKSGCGDSGMGILKQTLPLQFTETEGN